MSLLEPDLTTADLKRVRTFLYNVRLKWYDIGIELDVPKVALDEIKDRHNNDPAACLLDMLEVWLKAENLRSTWTTLAGALNAVAVDEKGLASEGMSNIICKSAS